MPNSEFVRRNVKQELPYGLPGEVAMMAEPEDERYWVDDGHGLSMRPLWINPTSGSRVLLIRLKRNGVIGRHRHPDPVHGYVIKGEWYYLDHDWVAKPGMYIYEPPGEIHTLVVPDHVEETMSIFQCNGAVLYLDDDDNVIDYDDVYTVIEQCRAHYEKVGIGADYVDTLIR